MMAVTQNGQIFRAFGADDSDFWFTRMVLVSGFRRFPSYTSDSEFLVSRPPWGAPSECLNVTSKVSSKVDNKEIKSICVLILSLTTRPLLHLHPFPLFLLTRLNDP
jgi:hypothetical protein